MVLFNSRERLLLGTLILDKRNIGVADHSFEHLSDLIHSITENGHRRASGPVHTQHPIRYINVTERRTSSSALNYFQAL